METNKYIFMVNRRDINYLRVTIESYDGMGVVRTIDPQAALIEVQVAPGCERLFFDLIGSLAKDEDIRLIEETSDSLECLTPATRQRPARHREASAEADGRARQAGG
jgi:hypothetical protein